MPFVIASTAFADLSDVSFDSSNCVVLSEGSMSKVSIPLPAGWKDGLKNPQKLNDLRKRVKDQDSFDDILSYHYNPGKNTEYVKVMKLGHKDKVAISHKDFKVMQEQCEKDLKDGSAKNYIVKCLPDADKDFEKRFQIFPPHEKNDHSIQFTSVSLDLDKLNIVFSVVSSAIIWVHDRAFIISARTIAPNKAKTMDKMTETRYFISNWVDVILKENGCEAHDVSITDDVSAAQQDTNTMDESKDSNEPEDESSSFKSKIESIIKSWKIKAKSLVKHNDQRDEPSSIHDDEDDIAIEDSRRPSIWRKAIIRGVVVFIIASIFTYIRKRKI